MISLSVFCLHQKVIEKKKIIDNTKFYLCTVLTLLIMSSVAVTMEATNKIFKNIAQNVCDYCSLDTQGTYSVPAVTSSR